MITPSVIAAIAESFKTAYGKNGLPCFFRISYSRRYCSFWRASTRASHLFLGQRLRLLRLEPRRCGGAELGHQVEVRADERRDQARDQQHVHRVEPAQR